MSLVGFGLTAYGSHPTTDRSEHHDIARAAGTALLILTASIGLGAAIAAYKQASS